jgi:hypothetical protein
VLSFKDCLLVFDRDPDAGTFGRGMTGVKILDVLWSQILARWAIYALRQWTSTLRA